MPDIGDPMIDFRDRRLACSRTRTPVRSRMTRFHKTMHAATALAALLVVGCGNHPQGQQERQRPGAPMSPARVAADISAVRSAQLRGDAAGTRAATEAMNVDVRRSMRLPDARRPIDPELARATARRVPDVRSAVWLDRGNLLVSIANPTARSDAKIDEVCLALEPLGDTLAVEVHLQNVAARNGDEAQTLSRNCQLGAGEHALTQRGRKVDVIDPALREEFKAQQGVRER